MNYWTHEKNLKAKDEKLGQHQHRLIIKSECMCTVSD